MSLFHLDIFSEILKLHTGVAQPDNKKLFSLLSEIHPLSLQSFPSGLEHNGWVVPKAWKVIKAEIWKDGALLFDGLQHPLAVAQGSPSFSGILSKSELENHIFYRRDVPEAFIFHSSNNYRPWAPVWGFCVPYGIWETWSEGSYTIELVTELTDGEMVVGDCFHQGKTNSTIVFNAHTCHPCQFNDDLAGVAVILALFNWLENQVTHYSYRAVFGPEHLGTVFYLAKMPLEERKKLVAGYFIEMVGLPFPIALQKSFTGESFIDKIAKRVLGKRDSKFRAQPFRTIVGNDETVWEAPGIEIPFATICRCKDSVLAFEKYHTQFDNLELNSESQLSETLEGIKEIVLTFESDMVVTRNFEGLVALSNPQNNLYVERTEPGMRKGLTEMALKLGPIQDLIPRYFDGTHSIADLAERFELSYETMEEYINRWEVKGLVTLAHRSLRP